MRIALTRLAIRNLLSLIIASVVLCVFITFFLPYDNSFRSLVRFHWGSISSFVVKPLGEQTWFFLKPKHPVKFDEDVGLIIKTGYGTQERVLAQVQAMELDATSEGVIYVGDFEATLEGDGIFVDVIDVVGDLIDNDEAVADMDDAPRALEYRELDDAILAGDEQTAKELGMKYGWQLDAVKFIPALELAYKRAPFKRWWVVIDDDTFLLKASFERLLARLDPLQDHYIGNPIGDYKARFAHGGSAIAISQRTLQHLFEDPKIVAEAKVNSLSATFGDKLVATTLLKLGVSLDERFKPFFNGFQPQYARMTADNFCIPIASFHGISNPTTMASVGRTFRGHAHKIVFWGAIWTIFQEPDIALFSQNPVRMDHDHLGRIDKAVTTFENVESALDCVTKCDRDSNTCLAWTWVEKTLQCHIAPFVILGDQVAGVGSGVHFPRAKAIGDRCTQTMQKAGCMKKGADCGL